MKIKFIFTVVNILICLCNSFVMKVLIINGIDEYTTLISNNGNKKVILYKSNPCKACVKMKDNLEYLSEKIYDWEFYAVDIPDAPLAHSLASLWGIRIL